MKPKIAQLREEIRQLTAEKVEREAALPAHSVKAHQLMAIEELEEEISRKQQELKLLEETAGVATTTADEG